MKCVGCLKDSNRKERADGKCPQCGKQFAFDPQSGDLFTDLAFQNAIERVSGSGTVKFTETNLFYELKKVRRSVAASLVFGGILGAGAAMFFGAGFLPGALLFLLMSVAIVYWSLVIRHPNRALARVTFDNACHRWRSLHGELPGLILRKQLLAGPPAQLKAELAAYSFDRAVITDTAETAELLLANNFHFENNCAVLSLDGHPTHAFEAVRGMLRKNPRLEVFALHDCTADGCNLAWKLKHDPHWFKDFGKVRDVALRPKQAGARALKRLREPSDREPTELFAVTEPEAKWLMEWNVKLAAFRPEQLIKRLYRAMQEPDDGGNWSDDATVSDGGADSFG